MSERELNGWAARRLEDGVTRPASVTITLDDERLQAYPGESLATAILAGGQRAFRRTAGGELRGAVCNMGVCFDCLVTVDGERDVRACMTPVRADMKVRTGLDDGAH